MTEYYFVTTEDPDDINMVAGLVKLGVLEKDENAHGLDYCDHDYCHEDCVDPDYMQERITEERDEVAEETEEEILDNLDEYASATVELKDAGCGCHTTFTTIEAKSGEYYLIHTDRGSR
jgi:hypothetical protein